MTVFIVDDSEMIRERLVNLLSNIDGIEILGQAEDALDATDAIRKLKPDVVISDIQIRGGSGIDVLKNIKRDKSASIVIMLANYPYPQYRKKCAKEGADLFFDKSTELENLIEALSGLIKRFDSQC